MKKLAVLLLLAARPGTRAAQVTGIKAVSLLPGSTPPFRAELDLLLSPSAIVSNNWGNILTVLGIPMAWQYMPLSIGSGAGMVFVAYDLYQILRGKSREERYGADE